MSAKFCEFCNREVEEEGHIETCPACGKETRHNVEKGVKECSHCGMKVAIGRYTAYANPPKSQNKPTLGREKSGFKQGNHDG